MPAAEGQRPIRVLLVDDDDAFLAMLAERVEQLPELSLAGVVSDGVAALQSVDEEEPDAVLIDLHMPLLDGVSTVARLRRDRPGLSLIAMTGDSTPGLRGAAHESGADVVLLKEQLLDGLGARVVEIIGRRKPLG